MPLLLLFLFIPILFGMLFFNILTLSFAKLGVHPLAAMFILTASLLGSIINLPISRQKVVVDTPRPEWLPLMIFYDPPKVRNQFIFINVGGAVIPVLFSIYLLFNGAPFQQTVLATLVMVLLSKYLAKPVPGRGIIMPFFIPPLLAAFVALIISPGNAAPVAYISGVLGTLIGADILNIPRFKRLGSTGVSIGGAGVFDGIFLVGIVAALLS